LFYVEQIIAILKRGVNYQNLFLDVAQIKFLLFCLFWAQIKWEPAETRLNVDLIMGINLAHQSRYFFGKNYNIFLSIIYNTMCCR